MKLALHELLTIHAALRGHPTDYPRIGALALEREGHTSPVRTETEHDGQRNETEIEWLAPDSTILGVIDPHRITEDGAEAVALSYAHGIGRWLVKRRLRRGEYADWLLQAGGQSLALEVSGTTTSDARSRLQEKKEQVVRCTLPVTRMAVVVAFVKPLILAGTV